MVGKPEEAKVFNRVSSEKRDFLRKLVTTTAFTVPVVASFSLDGLMISSAHAQGGFSNVFVGGQ